VAPYSGEPVACRRLDARLRSTAACGSRSGRAASSAAANASASACLGVPEERQLEWLGARTAAKEAVADLLRSAHGLDLLPAEIEILPGADGAPVVDAPGLETA
jgi:hypothetical protein